MCARSHEGCLINVKKRKSVKHACYISLSFFAFRPSNRLLPRLIRSLRCYTVNPLPSTIPSHKNILNCFGGCFPLSILTFCPASTLSCRRVVSNNENFSFCAWSTHKRLFSLYLHCNFFSLLCAVLTVTVVPCSCGMVQATFNCTMVAAPPSGAATLLSMLFVPYFAVVGEQLNCLQSVICICDFISMTVRQKAIQRAKASCYCAY
jgi:hypothetical protein